MNNLSIDERGAHVKDITGESADWRDLAPGIQMRVLWTCQATGTWAVLYKVKAGTKASAHKHFGSSHSYVIQGKMTTGGGAENGGKTLSTGDFVFEPNVQRVHEATYFEEDSLHLYIHTGPLMYLDEAGNTTAIVDWKAMRDFGSR